VRRASRTFLERVCGGHAAPALLHLVKLAKLSPEEALEIRELLDEKLSPRKESRDEQ
jgi:predicted transcriptional regulator